MIQFIKNKHPDNFLCGDKKSASQISYVMFIESFTNK